MRHFIAATLFVLTGCVAQGLPLDNGGGGGGSGTGGGASVDMSHPRDLGGAGAKCTTACDCEAGLACLQGACTKSGGFSVYCCDDANCPPQNICQSKAGGFSQCGSSMGGGGPGGGTGTGGGNGPGGGTGPGGPGGLPDFGFPLPDGGVSAFCQFIPCMANSDCTKFGCGKCGAGANGAKVCAAK